MPTRHRPWYASLWRQIPFFVALVALWMLLWGQLTPLALVTGVGVGLFVTGVFRLPPAELSGRMNPWHLGVLMAAFALAVIHGSLLVAWQVMRPQRGANTAIIKVPLRTDDDLIMAHVGVTASLIPGSLVVLTDRSRRVLYLHVIGVRDRSDMDRQREHVLRWEQRIVKALGSREQVAMLTQASYEERASAQQSTEADA